METFNDTPMKMLLARAAAAFRGNKYKALLVAAVIVLMAANISLLSKQAPRPALVRSESVMGEEATVKATGDIPAPKDEVPFDPKTLDNATLNVVHPNCITKLLYETQPSSVYKPGGYDTSFVYGSSGAVSLNGFYDVNGDNLPDYVYTRNWSGIGNEFADVHSESCIYLHNGTGWTKAYSCLAITQKRIETGEITLAQYYGDCGQF